MRQRVIALRTDVSRTNARTDPGVRGYTLNGPAERKRSPVRGPTGTAHLPLVAIFALIV